MNTTDISLFFMKFERHYNLQTKLTPAVSTNY